MTHPLLRALTRIIGPSVAALLLLVLPTGCRTEPPPSYIRLEGAAPELTDAPASHALLVVFWASWCPPCREETPGLLELAKKPPAELRVVVFSHDANMQAVEAFLRGPPPPGLHLRLDEGHAVARSFGVDTLPASILVVDGRLAARFSGPRNWNSQAMRRLLEKLSREQPARAPAPAH